MTQNNEKKVLIVEDDRVLRRVVVDNLSTEGFSVFEAEDGIVGLDMAKKVHPDLILLDVVMPRMDGITMLEKLREDEWGRGAKVIMLTNLSDAGKSTEVSGRGADDYLVKADWDIAGIIEKVKEKIRQG
jgi:DNA-binding response OmpR family regulator